MNKWLNFSGDLGTGTVFRICHYWEIRKVVSTDCAARHCSARHALPVITIATVMLLCHWPLAELCTVPMLLVFHYVIVMQAISIEFRDALPWKLLYADDLVVIAESQELITKLTRWKDGVQSKGLKMNMNKTKVMTSGYATMVHGWRCNPHRCTTTFANVEITSLWRHNSETIRDRQKRRPSHTM